MTFLNIENISGGYGDTIICQDFSARVEMSQIIGIFGRNGVGKTTLGRILMGDILPTTGKIILNETIINQKKPFERRGLGMGYLPQTNMVFDQLTVEENLNLINNPLSIEPYFEAFPKLKERLSQKAGTMSGGERKILAFVRAMVEPCQLLILDEPSEGVQPENINLMKDFILKKKETDCSVLLIEQNLKMLDGLVDHYWGIEKGQLVYSETAKEAHFDEIKALLTV